MSSTTTATPPTTNEIAAYVRAAARLQALPLSDAQVERVASHLARTAALAAALEAFELAAELEPAQIYEPAPFPLDGPHPSPLPQAGEGVPAASPLPLAGEGVPAASPLPLAGEG
ncbi:MAG TPA: AtzG-like protein [Burkholderiaceae bacterium]